jgi:pimeloyl-ACP methyl ester carboxylesterase/DNA-binding CsgD family transcriptional regulator
MRPAGWLSGAQCERLLYWRHEGCQPGVVTLAVRYCSTPAGRVAYCVSGTGPPLLCESGWVTHLTAQRDLFAFGEFMDRLAEHFTVIRYDKPGCGLSDRNSTDLSFDAQVGAALAVADEARARNLIMFGASQGGQIAAALAARHPERVRALVLYGMCADGGELAPAEIRDSVVALVKAHWGLGSKMMTGIFVPDPSAAEAAAFGRLQRTAATAEVASQYLATYYQTDIRSLLSAITAPTAVLHREGDTATRFELGREVAALISDAELHALPGNGHLYYHGDWQPVLDAMLAFLGRAAGSDRKLTSREMQVAKLVAAGLTNQAIASTLSVAPRTAEAHVENIRRKLDVRSRAQIAAWVTARATDSHLPQ